jgi:hypothetical protein
MILFTLKEQELSTFRCSSLHLLPRLRTFHIQVLQTLSADRESERDALYEARGPGRLACACEVDALAAQRRARAPLVKDLVLIY